MPDFILRGTLQITTNRKRSFFAGSLSGSSILEPVAIASRTTVTGLYASQVSAVPATLKRKFINKKVKHPEYGLISLGVISEVADDT